jgi:hypothetical protein
MTEQIGFMVLRRFSHRASEVCNKSYSGLIALAVILRFEIRNEWTIRK